MKGFYEKFTTFFNGCLPSHHDTSYEVCLTKNFFQYQSISVVSIHMGPRDPALNHVIHTFYHYAYYSHQS